MTCPTVYGRREPELPDGLEDPPLEEEEERELPLEDECDSPRELDGALAWPLNPPDDEDGRLM